MALITIDSASVDWQELRYQKDTLLGIEGDLDRDLPEVDSLLGIIALIDFLQDKAAEVLGDGAVFGS